MRTEKQLTVSTFIATRAALVGILVFRRGCIGYDVSLAIFGSALLGFVMSLTQYGPAKRAAMESFYQESLAILNALRKIKYFETDEPTDLVRDCIAEGVSNERANALRQPPKDKAKRALISYCEERIPAPDSDDQFFSEVFEQKIKGYKADLFQCMESYFPMAEIDLGDLNNAYGNLDFLFFNKKTHSDVYRNVYVVLKDVKKRITLEAYHFRLCREGKGNLAVCFDKVIALNNAWFSEEESIKAGMRHSVIYHRLCDELSVEIERFRSKIYNQQPMEEQRIPVRMKGTIDESQEFGCDSGASL